MRCKAQRKKRIKYNKKMLHLYAASFFISIFNF